MNGADPLLAVMAAYALGESGDKLGQDFLDNTLKVFLSLQPTLSKYYEFDRLREVISKVDSISSIFALHNRAYYLDSRQKLLDLLSLYSDYHPKLNVEYFDKLVSFSIKKTKGLIMVALSQCEYGIGNIEQAIKLLFDALEMGEDTGDPQLLKFIYSDLGRIHLCLGNYYSALELIQKSLEIDENHHDPWRKRNRTISNLSFLYFNIGQTEKALDYVLYALEESEKEQDKIGTARCLNSIGVILAERGMIADAEKNLLKALQLVEELNNNSLKSLIINNLAGIYFITSENDKAKTLLLKALNLAKEMSDKETEGYIRSGLAIVEIRNGNIESAKFNAGISLDIYVEICNLSGQSNAMYILGSIEDFYYENPDKAFQYYRDAIDLSEKLRENLLLDDFKISFSMNHVELYKQMVSLCLNIGEIEDAFKYIEKSKSRAFVDMISATFNQIEPKSVSQDILKEITYLKAKMSILKKQMAYVINILNYSEAEARLSDIEAEINTLEDAYTKSFEELKVRDPQWLSLSTVDVIDLKSVKDILDEKTALFEIYQNNNELILIIIKKEKLPYAVRINIDLDDETDRVYQVFCAISSGKEADIRTHDFIRQLKRPLSYFYELLIKPMNEQLKDIEHIIIIPHGIWHYLPFHAIYDKDSKEYLIDRHSISYSPSATSLYLCCKKGTTSYDRAIILANPSGDLPYAEQEGRLISSYFSDSQLFLREEAKLDNLSIKKEIDVLHIACHGYFRGDNPILSYLVLADEVGKPMQVYLPDIFNLRVKASHITLSACETGMNEIKAGDEIIGISRAFFYTGATSIITSMWTINDKSSSILMDRFYQGIVKRKETKAESLRNAIIELKNQPEYAHPYYWAAFYLTGKWE